MKKIRVFSLLAILLLGMTLVGCIPTPQQCTHQWEEWQIVVEATCLTSGLRERDCIKCPEHQEEVILKGDHSFVNYVNDEVHCTKELTATAICENGCGAVDVKVIGEAPGHDYVEISRVEASCTETGLVTYECHCGETTTEVLKELGHSYEKEETVKVSCTEDGLNTYTCSACGDSYTEEVKATGHDHKVVSLVEVTCTTDGETVYECHCGDSYTEVEKATGHEHKVVSAVEMSCEEDGEVVYECHCGDSYTQVIPSKGHNYVEEYRQELSCTQNASVYYFCHECGDFYEEILEFATGHSAKKWELVNEYEVGQCLYEQEYHSECENCYEPLEKYETIEKHSYTEEVKVTTLATCQEAGVKTYYCSCGKVEERAYTNVNAHEWVVDAETVLLSTSSAVTYHCANEGCKETKSEIIVEDTKAEVTVENLATSGVQLTTATIKLDEDTLSGLSNENITITADVLADEALDSVKEILGDKAELIGDNKIYNFGLSQSGSYIEDEFKGYVTVSVPYELAEGEDPESIAIWYVSEDGSVETIKAEYSNGTATFQVKHFSYYTVTRLSPADRCALYGHVENNIVVEPTCTEGGYTIHVCQRCGQSSKGEFTEALGHDTEVEVTPATCLKNGKEVHTCKAENCGYSYTTVIRALGHNYETIKNEPTCTEAGLYVHKCINEGCDQAFEEVVPATGHKFEYVDVPATCLEEGLRTYTCACGETYTEVLEATGHKWVVVEKVPATLESEGYIKYECHCGETYTKVLPILTEEDLTPNLDIISDALASLADQNMVLVLNDFYLKVYMGRASSSGSSNYVEYYQIFNVEELYLSLDENGQLVGSGTLTGEVYSGSTTLVAVKLYVQDNTAYIQALLTEDGNTEEQIVVANIVELIETGIGQAPMNTQMVAGLLAVAQQWYEESFHEIVDSLVEVNEQDAKKLLDSILGTIFAIEETEVGHSIVLNIAGLQDVANYLYEHTVYDVAELILGKEILENIDLVFDFSVSDLIAFLAERGLVIDDLLASLDDLVVILSEVGMVPEVSTVDELIAALMGTEEFNIKELINSEDVQNISVGDLILMIITSVNSGQNTPDGGYDDGVKEEIKPMSDDTLTIEDIKAMVNDTIAELKNVTAIDMVCNMTGMPAEEVKEMVNAIISLANESVVLETLTNELGQVTSSSLTIQLESGSMDINGAIKVVNSYEPVHNNSELKAQYDEIWANIDVVGNLEVILGYETSNHSYYNSSSYELIYNEANEVVEICIHNDYFYGMDEEGNGYGSRSTYRFSMDALNNFMSYIITDRCGDWKNCELIIPAVCEDYDAKYSASYDKETGDVTLTLEECYLVNSHDTTYSLDIYYNQTTNQFTSSSNADHQMVENEDKYVEAVGCTGKGERHYECVNCDYTSVEYFTNGHMHEATEPVLMGETCDDGVLITYVCKVCGDSYSKEIYWHEQFHTTIELSQYGSVCGGTIEISSCACGSHSDSWINTNCPFDSYELYYNSWYDYAIVYTCSVTDPACGFKYVEVRTFEKDANCQVMVKDELHFGVTDVYYNEETGEFVIEGAQYVYVRNTKDNFTEHEYTYEVLDESEEHSHTRDICINCGSYNEYEYFKENNQVVRQYSRYYYADSKRSSESYYEYTYYNDVQLTSYYKYTDTYPDYVYYSETYYTYDIVEGVGCTAYVQHYYNGEFSHESTQDACMYNWTSGWIDTDDQCTQSTYYHGTTHCALCGSTDRADVYYEAPRGHMYEWNDELQMYVCTDCGLENMWGADGEIWLEDCSDEDSDLYTVGYFMYDQYMEYTTSITLILNETGEEVYIDGVEFMYADQGRYISFSKSVIAEIASEYGYAPEQYRVRFNFVPLNGKDEFDYAITF